MTIRTILLAVFSYLFATLSVFASPLGDNIHSGTLSTVDPQPSTFISFYDCLEVDSGSTVEHFFGGPGADVLAGDEWSFHGSIGFPTDESPLASVWAMFEPEEVVFKFDDGSGPTEVPATLTMLDHDEWTFNLDYTFASDFSFPDDISLCVTYTEPGSRQLTDNVCVKAVGHPVPEPSTLMFMACGALVLGRRLSLTR